MTMTAEQLQAHLSAHMSEAQLEEYVRETAERFKRPYFHPRRSDRSVPGWPDDQIIVDDCLLVAELKTMTGKVSPDQADWLDAYRQVQRVVVRVWRPDCRDEIADVLRNGVPR